MIETCKDCRYCKRLTYTERVWDKYGMNMKTWYTYWCNKFNVEVPPINRCEHINEPIKPIVHHEIIEVTEC